MGTNMDRYCNKPDSPKDRGSDGLKHIFAMPELLNAFANTFRSTFLGQSLKYFTCRQ